jgi:hypothetical protein
MDNTYSDDANQPHHRVLEKRHDNDNESLSGSGRGVGGRGDGDGDRPDSQVFFPCMRDSSIELIKSSQRLLFDILAHDIDMINSCVYI